MSKGLAVMIAPPLDFSSKFPDVSENKGIGAHATVLYIGEVGSGQIDIVREACANYCSRIQPFSVGVKDYGEFTNKEGQKIPHMIPFAESGPTLAKMHYDLRADLEAKGIDVKHYPGGFKPHITLGYLNEGEKYVGPRPSGEFHVDSFQLWGDGGLLEELELTGRIKPLHKEIAFTGKFVDCEGREVNLTPELFDNAVSGSQNIMDAGFSVRGYSSHFTDDSKDIMGTWRMLWSEGKSIKAVFEAIDEESRNRAKHLDTSMVVEENIDLGNGVIVPIAITRIDIVGQGAVVGTEKFKEMFSRFEAGRQRAAALSSRRCLISQSVAPQPKGPKMKLSLKRGLARALGLAVDGEADETVIEAMIEETLGIKDMDDDGKEAEMSRALSRHFSTEDKEPEAELEAEDGDKKAEMMAGSDEKTAEMSAQLSRQQKEIDSLQDDKVDGLLQSVPAEKRESIKAQFSRIRKVGGFDVALETVNSLVDAYRESAPVSALSQFRNQNPTRVADRPKTSKQPQGENILVACARRKYNLPEENKD